MKGKKVKILLDEGCIIIETNELATVLKDKYGNIATVDQWGKVTWIPRLLQPQPQNDLMAPTIGAERLAKAALNPTKS